MNHQAAAEREGCRTRHRPGLKLPARPSHPGPTARWPGRAELLAEIGMLYPDARPAADDDSSRRVAARKVATVRTANPKPIIFCHGDDMTWSLWEADTRQ